jgi:putative flippase GtrA
MLPFKSAGALKGGRHLAFTATKAGTAHHQSFMPFVHLPLSGSTKVEWTMRLPRGIETSHDRPLTPGFDQLLRLARFGVVGLSGLVVNLLALAALLLVPFSSLWVGGEVLSAILSTQVAIGWNFLLTEKWVFRQDRDRRVRRFVPFWTLSCAALFAQLPLASAFQQSLGDSYLLATGMAIALLMVARFLVCDRWMYGNATNLDHRNALVSARSA